MIILYSKKPKEPIKGSSTIVPYTTYLSHPQNEKSFALPIKEAQSILFTDQSHQIQAVKIALIKLYHQDQEDKIIYLPEPLFKKAPKELFKNSPVVKSLFDRFYRFAKNPMVVDCLYITKRKSDKSRRLKLISLDKKNSIGILQARRSKQEYYIPIKELQILDTERNTSKAYKKQLMICKAKQSGYEARTINNSMCQLELW